MSETTAWTGQRRLVHVLSVVLMVSTVGLLVLGSLVTTHEVGMAVPDWPTTFEENMFTYNFLDKSFGIILEHSHRLAGSVIGLMTIGLGIAVWRFEPRQSVRWLALATFVGVCVQGVLGGARVVMNALFGQHLAAVHGCAAQAFLVLVVVMVAVTSKRWLLAQPQAHAESGTLRRLTLVLSMAVYLQMVLGAIVRHYQGSLWVVHLAVGGAIFFASLYLMMLTILHPPIRQVIGTGVVLLGGGLVAQITLGVVALFLTGVLDPEPHTTITRQEAWTVTTHLLLGSILLGVTVHLMLMTHRVWPAKSERPVGDVVDRPVLEGVV